MSDPTPIPTDDERDSEVEAAPEIEAEPAPDELAPEESELEGWLPEATPSEGPAPAP